MIGSFLRGRLKAELAAGLFDEAVALAVAGDQLRTDVLVVAHAGTCRDEFADNDILFQADERIHFVFDRRLRKDARRLLERSC